MALGGHFFSLHFPEQMRVFMFKVVVGPAGNIMFGVGQFH